jgi:parvulin-like peptidyl-prolyl isomerase
VNLRAATLLDEIRAGTSFDSVGNREAASLQPVTFQDLGTFGRNAMTPVFDTAAFTAPVGRATGPLQTSFGYHLLLVSKRTVDSVTAKHILVPITRTEESETAILMLADSTENLAEDLTLEEVGRIMGFEVVTAELNDAFPFLPGVGTSLDGADWAFQEAEPGNVSEVFENDQSFYVLELVSSTPGGVTPFDEAKRTIRAVLLIEKKLAVGTTEGQRLIERVKSGVTLSDAAAEMGLQVRTPGPFTRQDFVPDLGQMNAVIGTAFGLTTGSVSDPVPTRQNVFVIEKIAQTPADSTLWLAQKQDQRQALTGLIQQQRLQDWTRGLRAVARIVDQRAEVLTPVDDQTQTPYSPNMLGF